MNRRFNPFTLQQAADGSPTLAGLLARARDSAERLQAMEELIPADMRAAVQAGPAEDDVWCLLVQGSAAAAKLRQLAPTLVTRLKSQGLGGRQHPHQGADAALDRRPSGASPLADESRSSSLPTDRSFHDPHASTCAPPCSASANASWRRRRASNARAFRFDSGVEDCACRNDRGHVVVLPFRGQQILRATFDGRDLAMRSLFDEPSKSTDYLRTYGAFFLHAASPAWALRARRTPIRCTANLPNAPFDQATVVIDDPDATCASRASIGTP